MNQNRTDVLIIGAGAAGMMCALTAAQRGRSVLLLDHSAKLAEKIRISGGGRCNFTNLNAKPENYLSQNPHFCRSALARYTPQHFIAMLDRHRLKYHEKTLGQLFCDDGSEAIITMLKTECDAAGVRWCMPCSVEEISSPLRGWEHQRYAIRYRKPDAVLGRGMDFCNDPARKVLRSLAGHRHRRAVHAQDRRHALRL